MSVNFFQYNFYLYSLLLLLLLLFIQYIVMNVIKKETENVSFIFAYTNYFIYLQIILPISIFSIVLHFQGQIVKSTWLCAIQLVKYYAKTVVSASKVLVYLFRVTARQVCLIDDDQLTITN